jgi:type IV pilus assembly protein PilZ
MTDIRVVTADKRRSVRRPVEIKVDYRSVGRFLTDYSRNLSRGGLFVETCLPLEPGESVRLRLTLPDMETPLALDGVVKWVSRREDDIGHPPGMGIEFVGVDDELRRHVDRLVNQGE